MKHTSPTAKGENKMQNKKRLSTVLVLLLLLTLALPALAETNYYYPYPHDPNYYPYPYPWPWPVPPSATLDTSDARTAWMLVTHQRPGPQPASPTGTTTTTVTPSVHLASSQEEYAGKKYPTGTTKVENGKLIFTIGTLDERELPLATVYIGSYELWTSDGILLESGTLDGEAVQMTVTLNRTASVYLKVYGTNGVSGRIITTSARSVPGVDASAENIVANIEVALRGGGTATIGGGEG